MKSWSAWQPFPDPRKHAYLNAPIGPGVYQLRHRTTGEMILFGRGNNCAYRMSSLLPAPLGCGGRNNSSKREYLLTHIDKIEFRTIACDDEAETKVVEAQAHAEFKYRFST